MRKAQTAIAFSPSNLAKVRDLNMIAPLLDASRKFSDSKLLQV